MRETPNCETCAGDRLSAYLDGQLDGVALRDVDRHLAVCDSCRDELRKLEQTQGILRYLITPSKPSSEAFWANTYRLARTAKTAPAPSRIFGAWRRVGILAGTAAAAAICVTALINSNPVDNGYGVSTVSPVSDTVDVASLVSAHANYVAGRKLVDGANNRIIRSDLAAQSSGEPSIAPSEAFSVDPVSNAISD